MAGFFVILLAGFAGSFHCIGMCGGFACALGSLRERSRTATVARHLLYNSGRLVTYVFIGALAGLLGTLLVGHGLGHRVGLSGEVALLGIANHDMGFHLAGDIGLGQRLLSIAGGGLMILMALQLFGLLRHLPASWSSLGDGVLVPSLQALLASRSPAAPVALGVLNGFLPCPLVFAFAALAAAAGTFEAGVLTMAAFGLGTFPRCFSWIDRAAAGPGGAARRCRPRRVLRSRPRAGHAAARPYPVAASPRRAWRMTVTLAEPGGPAAAATAASRAGVCDHCGLPLGRWPYRRELEGRPRRFCCYGCFIGWQVGRGGGEEATAAGLLIRLGVGAFLAMNIMLFSLALYSGGLGVSDPAVRQAFHLVLWLFATPVMILLGGPFIREAAADLGRRRLSSASLISLGALAAYGTSVGATLLGGERVYFDTATMVLGLFTLGRFLEANGRARAVRNLAPLLGPQARQVEVLAGGRMTATPLAAVRSGDLVRVSPGDAIAVDGVVAEGSGFVDESWLTGEARPVAKRAGSLVQAGTINLDGSLTLRCTAGGLETRWAGICRTLEAALARPTAIQGVTDRVAAWFVPGVLAMALATFWHWSTVTGFGPALMNALAVLVVACPCALGLAAPLVTAIGLERLARSGCLLRSGDALYDLAKVDRVAVDKTGTLTHGSLAVVAIVTDQATEEEVLTRAGALEAAARHPLARGINEALAARGQQAPEAHALRAFPGRGVLGRVAGDQVAVGSARWLAALGWAVPAALAARLAAEEDAGRSAVYAGWNGRVRGVIVFDDAIRDDTRPSVVALDGLGVRLCVLSGDAEGPTAAVSDRAGIARWRAGLTPEGKAAFIRSWEPVRGRVAMVGDGINDGLALEAADVGIAVGDGIDLARETADAILPEQGLAWLPRVIALARHTRRQVMINLAWAFGYNAVAIALAASGLLQPVLAAALMAGSSLMVIANSLRQAPPGASLEVGRDDGNVIPRDR